MNINAITTTPEAVKGFYPTPPGLADKLLAGIDWDYIETVLEPSAGKGDLVKAAAQKARIHRYHKELDVDCVEIDPYLRSILEYEFKEAEQVHIVHDDFLTFQSRKHYENLLPIWIQSHDSLENKPPFEYPLNPLFSNRYKYRKRSEPLVCVSSPEHFSFRFML